MPAHNPLRLRRFSQRRRLRRQAIHNAGAVAKTIEPRRTWLSVKTSILPVAVARLAAVGKKFKLSRPRLVGSILEWFATQPKVIQSAILGRLAKKRVVEFTDVVFKRLLAG